MNRKFRRLQRGLLGACLSASLLAGPGLAGVAHAADEDPIATRDFVAVSSGATVTVDVTSNDADLETASDDLVVTAVSGAESGTASLVAGDVKYAAAAGFYGSDSFGYVVKDEAGNTATGTVDVFVYPGGSDPFARDDFAVVEVGGSVTVDILLNDVDPQGDAIAPIAIVTPPANGSVANHGTSVTYNASAVPGSDSFAYALAGGDATATVYVTVIDDAGDGPVPGADQIHAFDGESILIPVLANDADPIGGGLTLTGASILGLEGEPDDYLPARGTVAVDGDDIDFDAGSFTGSVFIEYTVEDADGNEATGFVQVLVTPYNDPGQNDPPIANPDLATVYAGQTVRVAVLQNDVDAEGDPIVLASSASFSTPGVRVGLSRGNGDGDDEDGSATVEDDDVVFEAPSPASNRVVTIDYQIQTTNGEATGTTYVLVMGDGDDGGGGDGGGDGGGGAGGGGGGPIQPFTRSGYRLVASDGGVFNYGGASYHGSTGDIALNDPIVGLAGTKSDKGYWLVASDGGVFSFGDAGFHGSTGAITLNKPMVGMAATPSGKGYWLVASDGGIFAFGDAGFFGSTGAIALNKPMVGMAATPSGKGYWLVASDGGIFAFGDAGFFGSTGAIALNKPVAGMTAAPGGGGYQLVARDGGVFSFGTAGFLGSLPGLGTVATVAALAPTPTGLGYYVVSTNGRIFAFGDAKLFGAPENLNKPIVGIY